MKRGFIPWLVELFTGPRCSNARYNQCGSRPASDCDNGQCPEHCRLYCQHDRSLTSDERAVLAEMRRFKP